MDKGKKIVLNSLYSICFQFILIPILCYITFLIYDNLYYINVIHSSDILAGLLMLALMFLNVGALYGLGYIFNKVYKLELIYYIITCLIVNFIGVWIEIYLFATSRANCLPTSRADCLGATKNFRTFTIILIFMFAYYIAYIVMHKLVAKKIRLDSKKKKDND